ncbi:Hsp20/alpha crystallin family protein [bacterium]|nr:Hsp20/alpha crystallin family protein [bacterium]
MKISLKSVKELRGAVLFSIGVITGIVGSGFLNHQAMANAPGVNPEALINSLSEWNLSNRQSYNRLIKNDLWDIFLDPYLVPDRLEVATSPLFPLIQFAPEAKRVETIDGDKELRIIAQVPNLNSEDVKVEANENMVTIKGRKIQKEKNNGRFQTIEQSFEQSVKLPAKVDADKISATVKDGVLTVILPKKDM